MNAARAIRQLEQAGFSHEQAASLVGVLEDEVLGEVATKEFVELTAERAKHELKAGIDAVRHELKADIDAVRHELKTDIGAVRHELKTNIGALHVEFRDRHIGLIKWLAGIAIVQTASIIVGTVGLMRLLG